MSLPKGLKYDDRVAKDPDGRGFWFVCQRKGHKRVEELIKSIKIRDAEAFRSAHDTAYHNRLLRHVGIGPAHTQKVWKIIDEFVEHREALEREGKSESTTTEHYRYMGKLLKLGFGSRDEAAHITPSKISQVIRGIFSNTNTEGAAIVAALHALRKMLRWKGLPVDWAIPHDEIQAKKVPKRELEPPEIQKFFRALPKGSVERAVVALKLRTAMRDVELRELRAADVDLEEGVVRFMLHAKREKKKHAFPLTKDALEEIAPWVKGKAPDERVFTIRGRRLLKDSLRKRFRKASAAAKIDPPVEFIGTLRAEAFTAAIDILGVEAVSPALGHKRIKTTEKHYRRYRENLEKKRLVAEALASQIPL